MLPCSSRIVHGLVDLVTRQVMTVTLDNGFRGLLFEWSNERVKEGANNELRKTHVLPGMMDDGSWSMAHSCFNDRSKFFRNNFLITN